jgi:hypothetical protein
MMEMGKSNFESTPFHLKTVKLTPDVEGVILHLIMTQPLFLPKTSPGTHTLLTRPLPAQPSIIDHVPDAFPSPNHNANREFIRSYVI